MSWNILCHEILTIFLFLLEARGKSFDVSKSIYVLSSIPPLLTLYRVSALTIPVTGCPLLQYLLQGVHSYNICYRVSTLTIPVTGCPLLQYLLQGVRCYNTCYRVSAVTIPVTGCPLLQYLLQGVSSRSITVTGCHQ